MINGKSDLNRASFSGVVKYPPRYTTPKGYRFLKFTICSEVVRQGEVKGWEYTTIQLSGDDADLWHQRGTLVPGAYIYAYDLRKHGGEPYESNGKWYSGDVFDFSSYEGSTLIIDTNHEENAGLAAQPIDVQSGRPIEAPTRDVRAEVEDDEGGRPMPRTAPVPTRAATPTRPATRTPMRPAAPAMASAAPVATSPVVPTRTATPRMAAATAPRRPTAEQQKAAAQAAVAATPTNDKYEDEEDIAF